MAQKESGKSTKLTALDALFRAVCDYFQKSFEDGNATPQDVKNAIQFLKDNGISALLSETNDDAPLNRLVEACEESGAIKFPFPPGNVGNIGPVSNLLDANDPAVGKAKEA